MSFVVRAATSQPPVAPPGLVSGVGLLFLLLCTGVSFAGGIDHIVSYDNSGIWKRSNQQVLYYGLIGGEIAGAVWLGGEDRLGKTVRQAIDSSAPGGVPNKALKHDFTRSPPTPTPDPHPLFHGTRHHSIPSRQGAPLT